MREGWKEFKLGDIIHIKHGYAFKGKNFVDEPNNNFLLTPGNFAIGGGFKTDKMKYYDGEIPEDYILSEGDVLVTMTDLSKQADTLGFSAKIPKDDQNNYLHNQRLGFVSLKTDVFDLNFIYWLLRTQYYQRYIAGSSSGATVKHTSPKKIYSYKFKAPTNKKTQRQIAGILSGYDDLIENNLKRIKLLEEQAQLTFELTFSNKELSKDWEEKSVGDLLTFDIGGGWGKETKEEKFPKPAYVIRGTDINELERGQVENVPYRWHKKSNFESRELENGDIVFEVSGGSSNEGVAKTVLITERLLKLFKDDVICASFCKLMRPKSTKYSHYLYLFLKYLRKTKTTEIYEKRSASNIVNYNWKAFLKYQKIKLPSIGFLEEFNEKIEPIFKVIYDLGNQNQLLKEARDVLLPRLMMGLVDVEELLKENGDYKMDDVFVLRKVAEGVNEYIANK